MNNKKYFPLVVIVICAVLVTVLIKCALEENGNFKTSQQSSPGGYIAVYQVAINAQIIVT